MAVKRYKITYKMGNKEKALAGIQKLTSFYYYNITGYYYSVEVENFLDRIADQHLQKLTAKVFNNQPGPKNIYHVITETYSIGGHTRLITNWIKNDTGNNHFVIIARQKDPVPVIIQDLVKAQRILKLTVLDNGIPVLDIAQQLRSSFAEADLIITHTHPDDIISYLALSDTSNRPVLHMNHADHVFWLGNHIDDLLVTYRENTIEKEKRNRGIANVQFLPIAVKRSSGQLSKADARTRLNISEDKTMLLTIAGAYKFTPCFHWNYFSDIISILEKYPRCVMYIIGIDKDSKFAIQYPHQRIIYCGYLADTDVYETAADIYVESYPFPSFTSFLQASLKGIACQLNHSPVNLSRLFLDNAAFVYPKNRQEWESGLCRLIEDAEYRNEVATSQSGYVYKNYSDETNWLNKLNKMYSELSPVPLATKRKRTTRFSFDMDEKLKFKVMNQYSVINPLRILFLK